MLNHLVVMGRIGHDLELKTTPSGKSVISFQIGIDRNRKREDGTYDTDWLRCVAWDGTAEFISRHFGKGSPILLEGRIQSRDWTDKSGQKRTNTEMIVVQVYFAGGKPKEQRSGPSGGQEPYYAPAAWMPTDADVPPEFMR